MTYSQATGFVCDGSALPISMPESSLERRRGTPRDLCNDCSAIVVDAIDFMAKACVVEPWSDDFDDLTIEYLDDGNAVDRRMEKTA